MTLYGAVGSIASIVGILVAALLVASLLTWLERRLLGIWQDRYGPNRVGPFGLLQVVADGIKIFTKDDWIPPFADRPVFVIAPAIIMVCMLMAFAVVPITPTIGVVDPNVGVLFFLAMTALASYSVLLAGYASNSKYALIGGLRSAAQMVSYEVFMGIALMGVVLMSGTFNLRGIVEGQADGWYILPQIVGFTVFLIAGIAESHRLPFDLPEAEHEIVAGFHTEYSSMKFGMFFIGEYMGVFLISAMLVTLYFGGWMGPVLTPIVWFCLKTFIFMCFFILLRAAIPRPRYDQLMSFGWKIMLPIALLNLVITGGIVLAMEG